MLIGSQRTFASWKDPGNQKVRVVLWQSRHDNHGIEWLVAPEPGARRVYLRHIEHRAPHRPCRVAGQPWTRTLVTITRHLAEHHRLAIVDDTRAEAMLRGEA